MKIKNGFKLRQLGNEFILIGEGMEQVNFNKMITMNETAAYLWNAVSDGRELSAEVLADLLTAEYDVTAEQALADAKTTLETWKQAEIIG